MSLSQHLVDRRVEDRHVALNVQASLAWCPPEGVEPSSPGGIRLDKLYFLRELRVASLEAPGERRVQIRNGFEALDPSHGLPGFDRASGLDLEAHLDGLAQHPGRELGKADAPEIAVFPPQPGVSGRVDAIGVQAGGKARPLVMDFLGSHGLPMLHRSPRMPPTVTEEQPGKFPRGRNDAGARTYEIIWAAAVVQDHRVRIR